MVGPEYISIVAAEAQNPRRLMRKAYKSFVWRLMFFFIGGPSALGLSSRTTTRSWQRPLPEKEKEVALELRKDDNFPFLWLSTFPVSVLPPQTTHEMLVRPTLYPWSRLVSKASRTWSTP